MDCTMAGLGGRVTIGSDAVGSGVHCGGSQRESSMLRGGQVAETGAAAPEAGQESTAVAQAAGRPWAAEWGP